MNGARTLETTLLLRLGLVLLVAFASIVLWLWLHVGRIEVAHSQSGVHEVMAEFFSDIAWTIPAIMVATLGFAALTLRRSLAPLRDLSERARAIRPESLERRLPEAGLPAEVVPLVRGVNELLDRLESGFAAQRRFASNAAHELRTPLQLLAAGLDALGEDPRAVPLREDVDRMKRLMGQLLELARLDARVTPIQGTADLGAVSAQVLATLAPVALARGVSVALERPGRPVVVAGDATLIGDLVRNLVENAIAASPPAAEVTVAVRDDGRLDVVDRGPGIRPEFRERIFERFWRAPDAPPGGSGLGLAIASEIAGACRASLGVADAPGGGAVFTVEFERA